MIKGATKAMLRSTLPEAKAGYGLDRTSRYWMSVNPSILSSSSATYWGATQMPAAWASLIFVVSRGGSAYAGCVRSPTTPQVPANDVARNLLRLRVMCMMDLHVPSVLAIPFPPDHPRLRVLLFRAATEAPVCRDAGAALRRGSFTVLRRFVFRRVVRPVVTQNPPNELWEGVDLTTPLPAPPPAQVGGSR